jgi:hypothetical protein
MKPRRTHASTRVFRLPGGTEDSDLWAEEARDAAGAPVVASVWEFTDAERRAVADGANVELVVWGTGTPPVAMHTTRVELGRPPA